MADFYLASTEGYGLEQPRACRRIRRLEGRAADAYLLVEIDPPLIGQRYGLGDRDVDRVILATRHAGQSLFPVSEWPLFVHVALPKSDLANVTTLDAGEAKLIAWGEIYMTKSGCHRCGLSTRFDSLMLIPELQFALRVA